MARVVGGAVISTPLCTFCMEDRVWNIQGRTKMNWPPMAVASTCDVMLMLRNWLFSRTNPREPSREP
jgi:hypothetical protein